MGTLYKPVDAITLFWEQSGELFCVLDADARFVRVNPAWTRVLGYREDEIVGWRAADLVHADDRCATEAAEPDPESGDLVFRDVENRYRHADGSVRWLRWNGFRRDGMWFGTARDITASRTLDLALRLSERRARGILEAMADGLVIMDPQGRIVEVNQRFAELTGRSVRELVGIVPPYPWWPPDQEDRMDALLTRYLASGTGSDEVVVMHRDGRLIPVLVNLAPLPEQHGEPMLLAAVRDISEIAALRDRVEHP
ncbi:MAG: PAS domain S-box protein [Solirubrobacteraceae bacterium]|nr:PAS domain S-box protein [Solirubrobacteraceae bacterium]